MGLVDCQGSLNWKGQEILGKKTFEVAHLGIGYVGEIRPASSRTIGVAI